LSGSDPGLSLREWELLNAVSLGARGVENAAALGALAARGFVRRDSNGSVVTTPEGEAYLREELKIAIRESASWLSRSNGPVVH
jgi:hypothetical protein